MPAFSLSPLGPFPDTLPGAGLTPLGFQQITDLSSAVGLNIPTNATIARIVSEGQIVRWRDFGGDPTTSVGMPLVPLTEYWFAGNLSNLKFIQISGSAGDAKLNVSYY